MYIVAPWPQLERAMLVGDEADARVLYDALERRRPGEQVLMILDQPENAYYDPEHVPAPLSFLAYTLCLCATIIAPAE